MRGIATTITTPSHLPWIHCITWSINEPFSHCYTNKVAHLPPFTIMQQNMYVFQTRQVSNTLVNLCLRSSLTRVGSKGLYELICPQETSSSSFNAIIHDMNRRIIYIMLGFSSSCPSLLYKPMDPLYDIDCNRWEWSILVTFWGHTHSGCAPELLLLCVCVILGHKRDLINVHAFNVNKCVRCGSYSLSLSPFEESTCGNGTIILFWAC